MAHRNARLTFHGRRLLVERIAQGMPIAHVAKAMGISRQCASRWNKRFKAEGEAGLHDRSSRPRSMRNSPFVPAMPHEPHELISFQYLMLWPLTTDVPQP